MYSASNASSAPAAVGGRSSAGAALPVAAISTPPRSAVKNALRSIRISSNTVITIRVVAGKQCCCHSHKNADLSGIGSVLSFFG